MEPEFNARSFGMKRASTVLTVINGGFGGGA